MSGGDPSSASGSSSGLRAAAARLPVPRGPLLACALALAAALAALAVLRADEDRVEGLAARAFFDIYLSDRALTWVRDGCAPADTEARFFVHAIPVHAGDLPGDRRESGFANLDFDFARRGAVTEGGTCVASVDLPGYPVARVRTGQWVRGEGRLWETEFEVEGRPDTADPLPPPPRRDGAPLPLNARIAKWSGDRPAAISVTHDGALNPPGDPFDEAAYAAEHGVVMDYEIVTEYLLEPASYGFDALGSVEALLSGYVPRGFGYFGHGYGDHDRLPYREALAAFRLCYEAMEDYGMRPVSYGYPRNGGQERETRRALQDAGFLSGRLQVTDPEAYYNVPGDRVSPEDWYALAAVPMESIGFAGVAEYVNGNAELVPILDGALERRAWIILTYHGIGWPGAFGWYDADEFREDVRAIASRGFWNAPMDRVTLYVRERERAVLAVERVAGPGGATAELRITLSDGLDNARFDEPLTVLFDLPAGWDGVPVTLHQDGERLAAHEFGAGTAVLDLLPNERPYVLRRAP